MYVHDIDTGAMHFFPLEPFIASMYIYGLQKATT